MRKIIFAIIFMLFVTNTYAMDENGTGAKAGTGNVNFMLGQKAMNKNDWKPVENQGEFGVMFDYKEKEWPISIAIDYLYSAKKENVYVVDNNGNIVRVDLEGNTSELNIGVRKIWEFNNSSIRPFIGGGLALIRAEVKATAYSSVSDDGSGVGTWLNGGVYWAITEHFNLGIELRYSQAEVTINNYKGEAGGFHRGLLLGYHW